MCTTNSNTPTFFQLVNLDYQRLCLFSENRAEAEAELAEYQEMWPDTHFDVIEGTDYITGKCRGCQTPYANMCYDAHGIETGNWCDDCYNSSKYPYRKDKYPTMESHGYGDYIDYPY